MITRADRIAAIREWHLLLRKQYDEDPRVGGYVRDVHFLLGELAVRDAQVALIERTPTEPQVALGSFEPWNRALFNAAMAIATEFARVRVAGGDLYDAERKVQDAVKALHRGVTR